MLRTMWTPILTIEIFVLIILYRAFCYEKRRGFLESAEKLYFKFMDDRITLNKPEVKNNKKLSKKYSKSYHKLLSQVTTVKKYILDTGMEKPYMPNAESLGFGQIQTTRVSVLDNSSVNRKGIADIYFKTLRVAIGYYQHRRNEGFNPLFWVEYLVFLPKQLLGYVGISSKSFVNIIQAIYWVLSSVGTYLKFIKPYL